MAENFNDNTKTLTLKIDEIVHGRFLITKILGVGGFGIIYSAVDLQSGEECALKELFVTSATIRAKDGKTVEAIEGKLSYFDACKDNFEREASTMVNLDGAPNVVRIIDFFRENNTFYYAMGIIDGKTVKEIIRKNNGHLMFTVENLRMFNQVASALGFMHQNKAIIHRDISPENIMISSDGEPIVIDFGSALSAKQLTEKQQITTLKPAYAPPEQFKAQGEGPWGDIYAMAATIYYSFTGYKIPTAMDRREGATYTPLKDMIPGCSEEFSKAIDFALKLDASERMQNIQQLIKALNSEMKLMQQEPEMQAMAPNVEIKMIRPIITINTNGSRQAYYLAEDRNVLIGRDSNYADFAVTNDRRVSKQHCIIRFDSEKNIFKVTDISSNGTYVNGVRLAQNTKYGVKPGYVISLANVGVEIELGVM